MSDYEIKKIKNDNDAITIGDFIELVKINPKFNEGIVSLEGDESSNNDSKFLDENVCCSIDTLKKKAKNFVLYYSRRLDKDNNKQNEITIEEYFDCINNSKFLQGFKKHNLNIDKGLIIMEMINNSVNFKTIIVNKNSPNFNVKEYYNEPIRKIELI